jgi:lipoate-protein ligase A
MDRSNGLTLKSIRLVKDQPTTGSWNMAIDDALLAEQLPPETAILRLYRWSPATLSLGYFQLLEDREAHQDSQQLDCVRRASGGGAILHDQELTYSFVFPSSGLSANEISDVYDLFHDSLISVFQSRGINAQKCTNPPEMTQSGKPFLCFQRRSSGDILLNDYKIVGSAQRRNRHQVLQHGSILLRQSSYAPELPGILELTNIDLTSLDWLTDWLQELSCRLNSQLSNYTLTHECLKTAHKIEADKFLNDQWTHKR